MDDGGAVGAATMEAALEAHLRAHGLLDEADRLRVQDDPAVVGWGVLGRRGGAPNAAAWEHLPPLGEMCMT